jgi:hypothetical protein
MKHKLIVLGLTLLLFLTFATPVFAQGPSSGDKWVLGNNVTLGKDEIINGDLVVFGGNVTVPESAKVNGDLVVFGGNATVRGTITGDVSVIGGNTTLEKTSVVKGSIDVVGGNIDRAEEAKVEGAIEHTEDFMDDDEDFNFDPPSPPTAPDPPSAPYPPHFSRGSSFSSQIGHFFVDTIWNVMLLLGLTLVSWLVAAFLPEQMQTVGDTVAETPLLSFGMGTLTALLAAILFIPLALLIVTICLAIVPFAVYTLLGVALLFGWIVMGQLIGERLLVTLERPLPSFAISTVVGVAVLTVISNMPIIGVIPFIGWFFGFIGGLLGLVVALTGLGAVVLTRYGLRPYTAPAGTPNAGFRSYRPSTPPPTPPATDFSRESQAEADLKAKIKAALAEARQEDEPTGPAQPAPQPDDEDEPEKKD